MDLEVQVRPGGVPGRAGLADDLAGGDVAGRADVLREVVVDVAVAVVAGDVRTHPAAAAVAVGDVAVHDGELGRSGGGEHVDALVSVATPRRSEVVRVRGARQRADHAVDEHGRPERLHDGSDVL